MNETFAHQSKPVVACIDGGDDGDRAMRFAIEEAQRRGTGLHLVHVEHDIVPYATMAPVYELPDLRDIGSRIVKGALARCHELAPGLYVDGTSRGGPKLSRLLDESEGAAAVVIGTREWSPSHALGGSTTIGVTARAHSPVIAVPPSWDQDRVTGRVVVGVDENAAPGVVLQRAFEAAQLRHAELLIVHTWVPPHPYAPTFGSWDAQGWQRAMTARLEDLTNPTRSNYPDVPARAIASYSVERTALTDLGKDADLLVLGRHRGTTHLVHRLGSVAHRALRSGTCPVEIVPVFEG